MTPAEILARAADLIERDWTQGANARNQYEFPVQIEDEDACSFCLHGAIWRVGGEQAAWDQFAADSPLREVIDGDPIDWNDAPGRTQQEVVAALRLASARAKEEK